MSRQATPSETVLGILRAARVVPVLRGETPEEVLDTAGILQTEGFTTLEITFTVPDAPQLIRTLAATTGVTVGAGTITSATMLDVALEAGATFFVSPGLDEVLLAAATALGIPYLPGTLTPSDIMRASARGASVLKLFPGSLGGPNYLKAMRDPFPDLHFVPTGGVNLTNLDAWVAAGAVAVGMGSNLIRGDADSVRERAREVRTLADALEWQD